MIFSSFFYGCGKMASIPCQCPGVAGKVCNTFLPAKEKDPHTFYVKPTVVVSVAMLMIVTLIAMIGLTRSGRMLVLIMKS